MIGGVPVLIAGWNVKIHGSMSAEVVSPVGPGGEPTRATPRRSYQPVQKAVSEYGSDSDTKKNVLKIGFAMLDLRAIIHDASADELAWDFWEDDPDVLRKCRDTVPGRIITAIEKMPHREGRDPIDVMGLLVAYTARRSLACWFVYCQSKTPLEAVALVVTFWLTSAQARESIDESMFIPCEPMSNGQRIVDCRRTDTIGASSAVAYAAKFTQTRSPIDAIHALSYSHMAYDTSPIGSIRIFERWLAECAWPSAFGLTAMSRVEQTAFADFVFPVEMQEALRENLW